MEYPFKDLLPLDEVLEREGYYKDWTHLDPEVFYSLTQISEYIKTKGYGVDVRLLISQLAEHFGLKTTQVVDLANLLQQNFENLEGVTQSFTNNINSLVAQMEADKDAVIANATVDSEVILARGGKATLGQRLDETTAQLAQKANEANPEFRTEISQHPTLSGDILPTASIDLGSGWSGNATSGFTHSPGNTQPLIFNFTRLDPSSTYRIEVGISKPDMSDPDGQSDYWLSVGGSAEFETYRGSVDNQVWGIENGGQNDTISVRPFSGFAGTLTFKIQRIISFIEPYLTFADENDDVVHHLNPSVRGSDSLYFGRNSGRRSLNIASEQNTGFGADTLTRNTSGFWNSAFGNRALLLNTTGTRNIAIGRVSLTNNLTGDRNVAIGTFAMYRNTSGRNNVALGADSLWYNTTGSYNIAIGVLALDNNRTGDRNVGIGDNALGLNWGGSQNTVIGDNAFYRVAESVGNVGVGAGAFRRLQTGERNTVIGTAAGANQTSGSQNIFIGYASGSSATSGDRNILIGYGVEKRNQGADRELNIGGVIRSYNMTDGEIEMRKLVLTQLPTTPPEREGSVWNDNGTLKIV